MYDFGACRGLSRTITLQLCLFIEWIRVNKHAISWYKQKQSSWLTSAACPTIESKAAEVAYVLV